MKGILILTCTVVKASTSMQGNYGFMDQRLAMDWTQLNIRNFGGDPNRVTLAGQSAGAMSAGCHLVSPGSKGLFSKVIQESNPLGLPFHDRSSAAKNANMMADYLGCEHDDVECLMGKSSDEIVDAQNHAIKLNLNNLFLNFLPFAPMVEDGGEIPEQPLYALARGNFSPMPMFGGSLYDEGQLFVYELFPKSLSKVEYKAIVDGLFGIKTGKKVMDLYPYDLVPNADDGRQVLNVLATDLLFFCPFRNITVGYQRALGKTAIPTYIYRFRHVLSFDCWGENYTFCVGYCCHGSELPFVFNVFTDGVSVAYQPTAEEVALTGDLSIAWSNFISSGDPNKGIPVALKYPLYDYDEDAIIILDEPDMSIQVHVRDQYCDLWDELGYFY
jgi:carboxylesterase type B